MKGNQWLIEAQNIQEQIIKDRRFLHSHAETGFNLKETVAYVKAELTAMGYEPKECGKAGLVALAGGKKPGKVFLLRADMDALPIEEEAEVDFPSKNGRMHACGHDMHTAMLLGAARLLKAHEEEIEGTIKLMFQPAEEILEGAHDMIEAGVLKNPDVEAALMIHVMAGMPFSAGTVIVSAPGISAPAADYFEIRVQGKGCHGSMPNTGVDPLNVAAHIFIALQTIQTRELAMADREVLTIGTLNAGTAANVIPDSVQMAGSVRAFGEETRQFLKERMADVVKYTAQAFRAEAKVEFTSGCPSLLNDEALSACASKYAVELLGTDRAISVATVLAESKQSSKASGSEDFAYVSQQVPSIMLALAAGHPDQGYSYPQHHPKVKYDETALAVGSAVYAYVGMRWLEENG